MGRSARSPKSNIVWVPKPEWQAGPTGELREHRERIARGYALMAELTMNRMHEHRIVCELLEYLPTDSLPKGD